MKPYQQIPIQDCGEPLVALPPGEFALETPHPYIKLGAPYGDKSPFLVRQGVLTALRLAQQHLQQEHPLWRIQIVDAYRPIAVQQFMVEHSFQELVRAQGKVVEQLSTQEWDAMLAQVYQFWAMPSLDPATPPPHSTGAAVDITLVDEQACPVDMGSPVDEVSPRSFPDHFADWAERPGEEGDRAYQYHHNRLLLRQIMVTAGFRQHPNEWWHFSLGDQMWVWLGQLEQGNNQDIAQYGVVHL
jgi:D-alanyl-D-alanine dipeptidase